MLYIRGSDFDGRLLQPNLQLILPLLLWLPRFSELQPLKLGLHHSGAKGFLLGGRKAFDHTSPILIVASSLFQEINRESLGDRLVKSMAM